MVRDLVGPSSLLFPAGRSKSLAYCGAAEASVVHYMRAAADNMIMYNNNLSTALVVATQTITPHAIVSSGAAPALAPATASLPPAGAGVVAHASPDKRNKGGKGKGGKGREHAAHSGFRRSRSRSPERSSGVPHRSEMCEAFNFDRRGHGFGVSEGASLPEM